jgi:hypothetical protein
LHHLVFALRQKVRSPSPPELPERASNKEVKDNEEDEAKDNPIHRGWELMEPQSYVRDPGLSRIALVMF